MDLFDQAVLAYEPWQDRDCNIVVARDRFVVTRRDHACVICSASIAKGSRVRARAEIDRDEQRRATFYFCTECCDAMQTAVTTDDSSAIDARFGDLS